MERNPRYHEVIPASLKQRVSKALSRFIFGDVDISPNEVNKEPQKVSTQAEQAVYASLQKRLEMDIDDLRWEATHGDEPPLTQEEIDRLGDG